MEATKRNALVSAASLGLGVLAAVLSTIALTMKPVVTVPASTDGKQLVQLDEDNNSLAEQLAVLRARLDRTESQLSTNATATPDAESMRGIVNDIIRDAFLRNRGRAKLGVHEIPETIVQAVNALVPGIALRRAELREKDDRKYYDIEGRFADRDYDFRIGVDGKVIEAELPPAMAPEAVVATIAEIIPGAQIRRLEKKWRNGREVFDAEARIGKDEFDLRLATDGTLIEGELPVAAAPAPVILAAQKAVDGLDLRVLKLQDDDGQPVYEVEGRIGSDRYEIDITAAGELLDMRMPTSRVPEIVRAAALKVAPGMRLDRSTRCKVEDGRTVYEIEGRLHGDDVELLITDAGEVIEVKGLEDQNKNAGRNEKGVKPPVENAEVAREVF